MRAIAFHPASQTRNTLAAVLGIALSVVLLSAAQAQIAQIYRIQNKRIRDIVLELVRNPAATAFGQKSSQSWLASPGSGWKSHHAYPGGLAVHTMEWVEVAHG